MKPPAPQASRAVLIGTDKYTELEHLPAVARNLTALREQLIRPEVWGLPPQHCTTVQSPKTPGEMIGPVHVNGDEATETLFVYYAGHGMRDSDGALTLALPSTPADPALGYYETVPYDLLRKAILRSRARHRIVIIDCCYSGSAIGTMSASAVETQTYIEGTYVLTSASPHQLARAPEGHEFTAFTGELLKVMRDGIPDGERLLTLEAIKSHITANLMGQGFPEPWAQNRNAGGTLPFIKNVAAVQASGPPGYGEIPGVNEGTLFASRADLREACVHRPRQAGICGSKSNGGAESIVLSGGYEDDEDHGDVIIYTGHGGQNDHGDQIADQRPTDSGNAALITSITSRYPVRVVRGAGSKSPHAPPEGFSYDGLYTVENYWTKVRADGYRVLQFRLEKLQDTRPPVVPTGTPVDRAGVDISRWEPVSLEMYRDRNVAARVAKAHGYVCQIGDCETVIETPAGFQITPTTHLKPITVPHKGPDIEANVLCLCPNHRIQLELGVITIEDDLQVIDEIHGVPIGELHVSSGHKVGLEFIRYHRELFRRRREE